MPVIKASSLRDLKNRVNIHDVVGRVVTLKKAGGGRFKGLCPFHSEKTPSFNVSADKGFYKCFGCGKAGDVINFVIETEGLQFTEAVEAIAQRFGVTLEYEAGSGDPRPRRVHCARKFLISTTSRPIIIGKLFWRQRLMENSFVLIG